MERRLNRRTLIAGLAATGAAAFLGSERGSAFPTKPRIGRPEATPTPMNENTGGDVVIMTGDSRPNGSSPIHIDGNGSNSESGLGLSNSSSTDIFIDGNGSRSTNAIRIDNVGIPNVEPTGQFTNVVSEAITGENVLPVATPTPAGGK